MSKEQSNPATLREALWAQVEERARQECPKGSHEDHECETCEHCHYYVDTAWIGVETALAARVNTMNFEEWWHKVGYYEMPKAGEPPEHAAIAKLAWEAALKLNGAVAMNESASQGLQRAASGTEAAPCPECESRKRVHDLFERKWNKAVPEEVSVDEIMAAKEVPAQAAASPDEGEGREAYPGQKFFHERNKNIRNCDQFKEDVEFIHACHIEGSIDVACRQVFERREKEAFERASRQSAAPSGGDLRPPSKLDGSMAIARIEEASWWVRLFTAEEFVRHKAEINARMSKLEHDRAIAMTESATQQLQAESKTGAVTRPTGLAGIRAGLKEAEENYDA